MSKETMLLMARVLLMPRRKCKDGELMPPHKDDIAKAASLIKEAGHEFQI